MEKALNAKLAYTFAKSVMLITSAGRRRLFPVARCRQRLALLKRRDLPVFLLKLGGDGEENRQQLSIYGNVLLNGDVLMGGTHHS